MMSNFVEIEWNKTTLEKFGLPHIAYPVPMDALGQVGGTNSDIDFGQMLYWCQEFCSQKPSKWLDLESAMQRLVEIIAPEEPASLIEVGADFWALHAGIVDLDSKIVTIQRNNDLVAATVPYEDGTLVWSVYRPLDAQSLKKMILLSRRPHPEHGVQMRENNWEFALDASAQGGSFYASVEGKAYLSYWAGGLGVYADQTENDAYKAQRNLTAMPPNQVAAQLGVYFQFCPDEDLRC
jgi:hypothetical protein